MKSMGPLVKITIDQPHRGLNTCMVYTSHLGIPDAPLSTGSRLVLRRLKPKEVKFFMKRLHILALALCLAVLLTAITPAVYADEWNKKTIVAFSDRVEVPGTTLDPGKYVLKLVDSQSDRHIVQIMNERENKVYATILAIPNYRLEPTGKTVVTFYEMPAGQPPALRAWFYPGDNFGQEFAYPKRRATEISQTTHTQVPEGEVEANKTSPTETAQTKPEEAPVATAPAPAPAPTQAEPTTPPPP